MSIPEPPASAAMNQETNRSRFAIFAALAGCGCLIALVFGGMVAAIVIPNFLDALQKAKQKRTVTDMRVYSAALTNYYSQNGRFPSAESIRELSAVLQQPDVLATDGWSNELRYLCQPSSEDCQEFRLISPGSDGVFDPTDPFLVTAGPIDEFEYENDIVLGPQGFLSAPRE